MAWIVDVSLTSASAVADALIAATVASAAVIATVLVLIRLLPLTLAS